MKNIENSVFNFENHQVRVVMKGAEPWWVAKDIADILDFRDAANAIRLLDEDEKGTQKVRTPGGEQEMSIISESGLYTLIMRSNKPEAKRFRKWVTSEVLPKALPFCLWLKRPSFSTSTGWAQSSSLEYSGLKGSS